MEIDYFNYSSRTADNWWDRSSFVKNWWRIYAADRHWVPPYYPLLRRELEPGKNSQLARMEPVFLWIEALPRRAESRRTRGNNSPFNQPLEMVPIEQAVAAAVALVDPRRSDGTSYLALLHCTNDPESLEQLLDKLAQEVSAAGCRRMIGPTGISPYLGSGLLQDHWDCTPPLHTAYDPPYLPEILRGVLEPVNQSWLYHLEVPEKLLPEAASTAELTLVEPTRLASDLLPLFQSAFQEWQRTGLGFALPDAVETAFLLRWVGNWPVQVWLAKAEGQAAGFVVLGPDLAPLLKRTRGGRTSIKRTWLRLAAGRGASEGRILFGSVLPAWRGKGIGRQLLSRSLATAQELGWHGLTVGPLPEGSETASFLKRFGAQPRQSYQLYQWEF